MSTSEMQMWHARTLIDLLHPAPHVTALIEITGLAPKQRPIKRYFTDGALAAECGVDINSTRSSVFVSINARNAMAGFEHNVPAVTAFGLDLQPERTSIESVAERLAHGGIAPTITTVSGHGAHMYLLLSEPAEPHAAKLVWERLCKYTGSDPIFNTNRIFRLTGTVNWKTEPRWCYLTAVHAERRYTIAQIVAALDQLGAAPVHRQKEGIQVGINPPIDWMELRRLLSPGVLDVIDTGEKNAYSEKQVTRSEADWLVICELVRLGAPDEMIHWIYETQPVGVLKYRSAGARYLHQTIASARRATADTLQDRPHTPTIRYARATGSSRDDQRNNYNRRMYR